MKRRVLVLTVLLVITISFTAASCVSSSQPWATLEPTTEINPTPTTEVTPAETPVKAETPTPKVEPEPEELPQYPLTVVDDLGRTVKIAKLPQRIISLAPSNTEILFALGLGESIVGVTQYCDYPEEAKSKTRVAGYSTPSLEKIVELSPDLIVAESIHEKMVLPALEKQGFTVIVTSAESIDTIINDISLVGQITGRSKAAQRLVDSLNSRIEAITDKTENLAFGMRPEVLYVMWHDPIWTMGSETFTDDLIQKAGGVNIFAGDFQKSRSVSIEAVIGRNPGVIIISGMGTSGDTVYDSIMRDQRLSAVAAIAQERVYKIQGDLIERPGPRIVDGLEQVAKALHPEIFGPVETKP